MNDFARWIEESTARTLSPGIAEQYWEQRMANADVRELFDASEWHTLPRKWFRKPRQRKPRRASIRAQIAAAETAGKVVTSITLPDGTVLQFGDKSASEPSNELDKWLGKRDALKA